MTIAKNITQCSRALWALEHWQKTSSSMPGPPGPWHAGCWGHSVLLWHLGKIQNLNTVLLLVSRQLDQSEGFKIFADGQVDRQTENSICWYRRPEGGWTKRTPPPYLHGHWQTQRGPARQEPVPHHHHHCVLSIFSASSANKTGSPGNIFSPAQMRNSVPSSKTLLVSISGKNCNILTVDKGRGRTLPSNRVAVDTGGCRTLLSGKVAVFKGKQNIAEQLAKLKRTQLKSLHSWVSAWLTVDKEDCRHSWQLTQV